MSRNLPPAPPFRSTFRDTVTDDSSERRDADNVADVATLEQVPIRDVCPDEAKDLTPWLADNLQLPSDSLGMDLELEGQELSVGQWSGVRAAAAFCRPDRIQYRLRAEACADTRADRSHL